MICFCQFVHEKLPETILEHFLKPLKSKFRRFALGFSPGRGRWSRPPSRGGVRDPPLPRPPSFDTQGHTAVRSHAGVTQGRAGTTRGHAAGGCPQPPRPRRGGTPSRCSPAACPPPCRRPSRWWSRGPAGTPARASGRAPPRQAWPRACGAPRPGRRGGRTPGCVCAPV